MVVENQKRLKVSEAQTNGKKNKKQKYGETKAENSFSKSIDWVVNLFGFGGFWRVFCRAYLHFMQVDVELVPFTNIDTHRAKYLWLWPSYHSIIFA